MGVQTSNQNTKVFAIVVFGTISDQGYYNPVSKENGTCMFNNNECACGYAVGIGVLAFLACVVIPVLDIITSKFCSAEAKKRVVIGDLASSTAGTFLWFSCFCVLANQWARTNSKNVMVDAARAAIAFSFFSIITWAVLACLAYGRYNQRLNISEWLTALFSRIMGKSA